MFEIAVFTPKKNLEACAKKLADELHLSFTNEPEIYEYILLYTPSYLGLKKMGTRSLPLYVDFLSGKLTYRRQHTSLRQEALARALGLNHRESPTIIDATAGLAQDSFILASLGFTIQLLERSPIMCALLQDGIKRALQNKHVAPIVERLQLIEIDAISWLQPASRRPELIYLDPMFPCRQKSALVKKEMRILQTVLGQDEDADDLLAAALACATQRVVVKRPRLAEPLMGSPPDFSLKGSSSRFDVYIQSK